MDPVKLNDDVTKGDAVASGELTIGKELAKITLQPNIYETKQTTSDRESGTFIHPFEHQL